MARENSICKWIGPPKYMGKQEWCSWWTVYFEEFLKNRKQIRSNLWEKSEHREFHFWVRVYFSHQTSLVLLAMESNIPKTQSMCLQLHVRRILRDEIQSNILIRKNIANQVKLSTHLINHFPFANILGNWSKFMNSWNWKAVIWVNQYIRCI